MIKVGLIGESPYDTKAIQHLLQQKYYKGFRYTTLLKNITGDHLNTPKAIRAVVSEVGYQQPNIVVVIRDGDALASNSKMIKERMEWYQDLSVKMNTTSFFLLNIYELEALILADMESFNARYKVNINFKSSVSHKENPKEFLKEKTSKGNKQYHESHCPELFQQLNFDTVVKNCAYFKTFVADFEMAIK